MNELIGEREVLGLKCRPSFEALVKLEAALGRSIVQFLLDFNKMNLKMNELAHALFICHKEYDPESKVTFEDVGSRIIKTGYLKSATAIVSMLDKVLNGESKEDDEQEKKQ